MRAPVRQAEPQFSQPVRQVTLMLIVVGLVAMGGWFAYARIYPIFLANPWLNGLILGVFVFRARVCCRFPGIAGLGFAASGPAAVCCRVEQDSPLAGYRL